jgi:hypothetical protein
MTKSGKDPATGFALGGQDCIRHEQDRFFSTCLSAPEGFQLKTWPGVPVKFARIRHEPAFYPAPAH